MRIRNTGWVEARPWLLLAGAALALAAGGCGRGKPAGSGAADGATARKVLTYAVGNDIANLDPALIADVESAIVATQVCQGLVKMKADSVEVEPDLAEKWEVSPDGKTTTFTLREGVRFHDGTPCNSEAVRFSIVRQMDRNHPFHVPGKMRYAKFIYGDPATTETSVVTDISTPDERTVVIALAQPSVPFLRNLTLVSAAVVSPRAAETYGRDFNTTMVGTGPFRLKSCRPMQAAVLERNPDYWGSPAPLDEIRFRIVRDANVRLNSIRKGESDVISGIDPASIPLLEKSPGVRVVSEPSMNTGYLSLNCQWKPFDDPRVRRAMNLAVDRTYIAQTLFGGTSAEAAGFIPPGMTGFDPARKAFAHDPEEARRLLAEAGYPGGFMVKLLCHDRPRVYNPMGVKLAERVQQDLAKAGVTVKIEQVEFPAFLDRMRARDYQMGMRGWVTDNGDPDNFLYELAGREDNELNYINAQATRLMRDAAQEPDEAKRGEMYRRAEDMVVADAPAVFLNHGKQVLAVRDRVTNFKAHPTAVTQLQAVDVATR
jgi:peptide/nickel transport system substrate-binding protein